MNTPLKSLHQLVRPIRTLLVEFCDNSNIHGVRYITERFLHWSERLWWIIALGASLGLCGSAALNIWTEWRANPMTLSFTEQPISISKLPFPTITICPDIKAERSRFNLTAALNSLSHLSEIERMRLNTLAHICPRLPEVYEFKEDFADESIYDTMKEIALEYRETFIYLREYITTIVPVFTEEGVCFTYNALNSHDIYTDEMAPEMMIVKDNENATNWSLGKDFQNKSTALRYPIHEVRSVSIVFSVDLKGFDENVEDNCKVRDQGFNMIFSTPGDALQFTGKSFRLPLEETTVFSIKPELTITSDGLRKYDVQQRQCFFDSERRLRFFKIYSQRNCEEECLANFTLAECGCVKFSQPRDVRTKVCGGAKIKCYKRIAEDMLLSSISFRDKCNYLPACTSIEYVTDIDRIRIDDENFRKVILSYRPDLRSMSLVFELPNCAFFSQMKKQGSLNELSRTHCLIFWLFVAVCLAYFWAFQRRNHLCIVEIIYFLTLRLYFIIRPLEVSNAVIPFQQESSNIFERVRFLRGIRAFVIEFCDNTSIHGVLYFTRRGLHWIERLWWIIAFGLSLWLCTSMNIDVWHGWQENPVKMAFTLKERPISDIPFPTVTICPMVKCMKHKLDLDALLYKPGDTSKILRSLYDNETFRTILHVCPYVQRRIRYNQIESMPPNAEENIYDTLRDIAPQFNDVLSECIWQGEVIDCRKYMAPIITDEGLCFIFNALNSREIYTDEMAPGMMTVENSPSAINWSLEKGYAYGTNDKIYPFRVFNSGRDDALKISLDVLETYFETVCKDRDQGFHVRLYAPGELNYYVMNSFQLPLMEESMITITPKLTTTSEGLRKYNPNHRKCYFDFERKLRFYKIYTQSNCEMECQANFTKTVCGCVKFSQPRDKNTPICGAGKILCYNDAEDRLKLLLASDKQTERKHTLACNCLPSCTTIYYNAVIDRVKYNKSAISLTAGLHANMSGLQRTRVEIHFEDRLFETEQREELYTVVDLFAICGGLFGLFMGISILSIVEIVYYSTIRWYWILRRPASE